MLKLDQKIYYIILITTISSYLLLVIYLLFFSPKPPILIKDCIEIRDFYKQKSKDNGKELVFTSEDIENLKNNDKYKNYTSKKFIEYLEKTQKTVNYHNLFKDLEIVAADTCDKSVYKYFIFFLCKTGMKKEVDMKNIENFMFDRELKEPLTDFENANFEAAEMILRLKESDKIYHK